jgi:signal transduction histidine kinase
MTTQTRWRLWIAVPLFWTAIGLLFALPRLAYGGGWSAPLLASLAEWWAWGLLAPAIFALDVSLDAVARSTARRLLAHAVLGTVTVGVYVYLRALLAALLQIEPWTRAAGFAPLNEALRGGFPWALLVYCLLVGGWWAYRSHHRVADAELRMERLERNYAEARLNALRQQLDPHFLFNALNTISAQLETEPRRARRMIEHLGDLLRLSLDPDSRSEVSLATELAFLDHYLAIQKIRFADTLAVTLDIPAEARGAAVPSLFLQPLVENAIRHGVSRRAGGGAVTVTARRDGDCLTIAVADDGVGLPPGWDLERQTGLGLLLTRERIAGIHTGGASRFEIGAREGGGTAVAIRFPFRAMESV